MDKKALGDLIRYLRQSKNLNQDELAKVLNVSNSAVSKWERGLCIPDVEVLESFSRHFNLPIAEFFSPAETLLRLQGGSLQPNNPGSSDEQETFVPGKSNRPFNWKNMLYGIIPAITLIVLCLIGGTIYHALKPEKLSLSTVAERYGNDEVYGEVYDFAVIYQGDLDYEDVVPFGEKWLKVLDENTSLPSDIHVIRFLFYQTEDKAFDWQPTDEVCYFLR